MKLRAFYVIKKTKPPKNERLCTRSRDRTGTAITGHWILSPARLPIPPSGHQVDLSYQNVLISSIKTLAHYTDGEIVLRSCWLLPKMLHRSISLRSALPSGHLADYCDANLTKSFNLFQKAPSLHPQHLPENS